MPVTSPMESKNNISRLKEKVLAGGNITSGEAMSLADLSEADLPELYEAAAEVNARFHDRTFDSCSIINARSGRCPEDCAWCAQSACHATDIETYPLVSRDTCLRMADLNRSLGIKRFSFVTSGRALKGRSLDTLCEYYAEIHRNSDLYLCASMGLLDDADMKKLYDAGVRRYHCNLETAPSHFPTLCSTHTQADKLRAIEAARRAGMEICSGGIIGMGETQRQRVEFALTLRDIDPVSVPINILIHIPGTPLQSATPLTDDEILSTIAIFRLVMPRVILRLAGGRARLSPDIQLRAMKIGITGAIMGDMLTTLGSTVEADKRLIAQAGFINA